MSGEQAHEVVQKEHRVFGREYFRAPDKIDNKKAKAAVQQDKKRTETEARSNGGMA